MDDEKQLGQNNAMPQTNRKNVDITQISTPQNNDLQKLLTEEETLKKELSNLDNACSSDQSSARIQQYVDKSTEPLCHPANNEYINCFTSDTLILLFNKKSKRIDEIKVNDEILSFDMKNSKYLTDCGNCDDANSNNQKHYKQISATVTHIHKSLTNEIMQLTFKHKDNNENVVLKCTRDHPIWTTNKGWSNISGKHVSANHIDFVSVLQIGDECLLHDHGIIVVTDIQAIHYDASNPIYVYNLTVNNTQNFFANNILVHNKSCCVIL